MTFDEIYMKVFEIMMAIFIGSLLLIILMIVTTGLIHYMNNVFGMLVFVLASYIIGKFWMMIVQRFTI